MGVVVGWTDPGAGSTVKPSVSPWTTPDASTGAVRPAVAGGSSPADTVLCLLISQSW